MDAKSQGMGGFRLTVPLPGKELSTVQPFCQNGPHTRGSF